LISFLGEQYVIPPIQMSARAHTQTDRQKWKQNIRQFHSVHLAGIIRFNLLA